MIWSGGGRNIFKNECRNDAQKDFKIKDIEKKFFNLCTEFGLDKDGKTIPEGTTLLCDDF